MTYIIIIVTVITSYLGFQNREIFDKYKFNPYMIYHRKEYARILGHGFLHADWTHLLVNMLVLWSFGITLENYFAELRRAGIIPWSTAFFLILYLGGLAISSLPTLFKNKDDHSYNSIGASGAVSSVTFACIFLAPMQKLYLYFIPIPIPGFIFGISYLAYSYYMSRQQKDNVNHDAHFVGAIWGFLFPVFFDLRHPLNIFAIFDRAY